MVGGHGPDGRPRSHEDEICWRAVDLRVHDLTCLVSCFLVLLYTSTLLYHTINSLNGMKHVLLSIVQSKSLDITYEIIDHSVNGGRILVKFSQDHCYQERGHFHILPLQFSAPHLHST